MIEDFESVCGGVSKFIRAKKKKQDIKVRKVRIRSELVRTSKAREASRVGRPVEPEGSSQSVGI